METRLTNFQLLDLVPGKHYLFTVRTLTLEGIQSPASSPLRILIPKIQYSTANGSMVLQYDRVTTTPNVKYTLQTSIDLKSWRVSTYPESVVNQDGFQSVTVNAPMVGPQQFFRIAIAVTN